MALRASETWPSLAAELAAELGSNFPAIEYEQKGGLVVATTTAGAAPLLEFAAAGVTVVDNSSAWRMDPDEVLTHIARAMDLGDTP